MKTIPAALTAHYATRQTTIARALKLTRTDGQIFGFTSDAKDVTIDGVLYWTVRGLDASGIVISSGLAVGTLELRAANDGSLFTTADILEGVWNDARFVIFEYNWASPSDGINTLLAGVTGEAFLRESEIAFELRDLRQFLQQDVGSPRGALCRYRLGSTDKNNGGLCLKDISAAPFTVTGTLTSADDNQTVYDTARTEADDYFGNGLFTFTSGDNGGLQRVIKSYDGTAKKFVLDRPMLYAVAGTETYTAVAGCRKRRNEDCRDKFDNVLNFGGEPDAPTQDELLQPVTVSA